jgi:uncharacterized protein (TIGR00255 family)
LIRSMTAYGRGEHTSKDTSFTVEIKSVNNRYRDIIVRSPKSLQGFEEEIRSQVASRTKRGRIEVFIQLEKGGEEVEYDLELNMPLVKTYLRIFKQLGETFGLDENISLESLCQMRDVIMVKPEEVDVEEVRPALRAVLELALDSYDAMRIQEGQAIEEDFHKRLQLIEAYLNDIKERAPLASNGYEQRLKDKIKRMSADIEIDETRLIQEVAIFSERCDMTEEVVRATSHLKQFRHYMDMEDAIGRRLDFLLQEINREVNTLSSKAQESSISAKAVEIKAELEKLREQAQNVE